MGVAQVLLDILRCPYCISSDTCKPGDSPGTWCGMAPGLSARSQTVFIPKSVNLGPNCHKTDRNDPCVA
jgi:hypothetical protein